MILKASTLLSFGLPLLPLTKALRIFADRIPNGLTVPNPGPQGGVWAGVGHENAAGGGARNPFGLDFKEAGFEWTESLCQLDSDGDGRSNGMELGDPDCLWTPNDGNPPDGPAVSHPGIVDEPKVSGDSSPLDACDNYEDPSDVQVLNISYTSPNVLDSTRTHYRCEQLVVEPPGGILDLFQVRSDVILNNPKVLHHIWIYHCPLGDSSDGNRVGQGAYSCNGVEGNCQIIAGWAVGPETYCEPPNVASYVDFRSSKVFKIEAHYDNSEAIAEPQDQSGMSLRFTATPRPLTAGLAIVGMDYWDRQFFIPAGQAAHPLRNICPTQATQLLPHPIYVYSWNPHMHLHGQTLVTEHYRCGEKIGEIGRIEAFEFDNQQSYTLSPPVKILPGDALVTTCTYDSTAVVDGILGGEETTEEMCDNYLTYYPFVESAAQPTLFTACNSFERGLNPAFADGFDDTTPFATLDLTGSIFIDDFDADPTQNIAPCCASATCEEDFRALEGAACAVSSDCVDGFVCNLGLCGTAGEATPGGPVAAPTTSPVTEPTSGSSWMSPFSCTMACVAAAMFI